MEFGGALGLRAASGGKRGGTGLLRRTGRESGLAGLGRLVNVCLELRKRARLRGGLFGSLDERMELDWFLLSLMAKEGCAHTPEIMRYIG